jgi:serine/threonine protein kinase
LRGKEYTQASDIYGFGIIAYELCTGLPPYYNVAHDEFLAIKICQGLRPSSNYKIPQLVSDIIQQCWDADPLKRPKAGELWELLNDLWRKTDKNYDYDENFIINQQIREADEINKQLPLLTTSFTSYATHPQAIYTSRLLDFKNLPEPKNSDDNNDNSFETEFSGDYYISLC